MEKIKKNQEMKIFGKNASLMAFKFRPKDLIRVYLTEDRLIEFKNVLKFCSENKLAYHIVSTEEMERISKASHHENVCMIFKIKKSSSINDLFLDDKTKLILALEEVENPHNLGAIMRTSAHFGVSAIIYQAKVPVALSGSAFRTAEGGAESVEVLKVDSWEEVFRAAEKHKFKLVATSGADGESLFHFNFREKMIIFLGAEGRGLSAQMMKKLKLKMTIPGTGHVESLNVSNATTSILTEWYRQTSLPK